MVYRLLFALFAAILAAGCGSPNQAPRPSTVSDAQLEKLRAENEQLRNQLSLATRTRMWEIGKLALNYASDKKKWPSKPSDLRIASCDQWKLFIAPYDTSDKLICTLQSREDVWDWIDANSSYVFFGGDYSNSIDTLEVIFQERTEFMPGFRWQYFNDLHLEQLESAQGTVSKQAAGPA